MKFFNIVKKGGFPSRPFWDQLTNHFSNATDVNFKTQARTLGLRTS